MAKRAGCNQLRPRPTSCRTPARKPCARSLCGRRARQSAADEFHRLYDVASIQQKLRALQRAIDELDATHPGAPPRAMALVDRPDPDDVAGVHPRQQRTIAGRKCRGNFWKCWPALNRKPFQKGSGRLELAEAIVNTNNPLTARVFVNRVWLHHFGTPLVATPSDFGLRSDPPTHPELLDYLASRFMADGWSVKKLAPPHHAVRAPIGKAARKIRVARRLIRAINCSGA